MDWSSIKWFGPGEFNHPEQLDPSLIYLLDFIRDQMGVPFISRCDYDRRGHGTSSQHYYGRADDGHFVRISFGLAVDKVVNIVETCTVDMVRIMHPEFFPGVDGNKKIGDLIGLGIYPQWNNPGFHFDTRGHRARWGAKYIWVKCKPCDGTGKVLDMTCAKCGGLGKIRKQDYIKFEEAYQLIR